MKRFFILTALMAVLGLSSCEKEPSKAIVGTWEVTKMELSANGVNTTIDMADANGVMKFTFNADGSGNVYFEAEGVGENTTFEYEVVENTLKLTDDEEETYELPIIFEEDMLIIEVGEEVIGQANAKIKIYFKKA